MPAMTISIQGLTPGTNGDRIHTVRRAASTLDVIGKGQHLPTKEEIEDFEEARCRDIRSRIKAFGGIDEATTLRLPEHRPFHG
jgi:hypothetical protein